MIRRTKKENSLQAHKSEIFTSQKAVGLMSSLQKQKVIKLVAVQTELQESIKTCW